MPPIRRIASLRSPQKKSYIQKVNADLTKEIVHKAIDALNERKKRIEQKKKGLVNIESLNNRVPLSKTSIPNEEEKMLFSNSIFPSITSHSVLSDPLFSEMSVCDVSPLDDCKSYLMNTTPICLPIVPYITNDVHSDRSHEHLKEDEDELIKEIDEKFKNVFSDVTETKWSRVGSTTRNVPVWKNDATGDVRVTEDNPNFHHSPLNPSQLSPLRPQRTHFHE
jgi:hypothetical protein